MKEGDQELDEHKGKWGFEEDLVQLLRGSGGLLLGVMSDCQHEEWTNGGLVAILWRLHHVPGLWCAGTRMARWRAELA